MGRSHSADDRRMWEGPAGQPWTVYTLADPRTGFPRYVGSTYDLRARISRHLSGALRRSGARSVAWIRELRSLGLTPRVDVAAIFYVKDDAREFEGRVYRWMEAKGLSLLNQRRPSLPEEHPAYLVWGPTMLAPGEA